MRSRRRSRSARTALTALVVLAVVVSPMVGSGIASAATSPVVQPPVTSVSPSVDPTEPLEAGHYIVQLADPSVATYDGGVSGLPATAAGEDESLDVTDPDALAYADYLDDQQAQVADSVDVQDAAINASYTVALNGFSAELTADQATALAGSKDVVSLTPDEAVHVASTDTNDFLGLTGTGGVWDGLGGVADAGAGVVIGMLDSGIAPENPAFVGSTLGTTPGADPYLDGDDILFEKADGSTFVGACETGEGFVASDCSTEIISARSFSEGREVLDSVGPIGDTSVGEYDSPRDGSGHGSHTASTAAGTTGVAPAAKLAIYKVCWQGADDADDADDVCSMFDIIDAIEQAVTDGVDVLNMSLVADPSAGINLIDLAMLSAAAAGISIAASAGNDGPDAGTVANAVPWETTVAASSYGPASSATVPQVAAFSSRGPVDPAGGDILKPDVAAPGVAVLGALNNAPGGTPTSGLLSGTSMASPHVAGLAALYLGKEPDASPAEIRSALMTTAYNTVDGVGEPVTNALVQGAGEVDAERYLDAGLYYDADGDAWAAYAVAILLGRDAIEGLPDPVDLNQASIAIGTLTGQRTITRTLTALAPGDYTATIDLDGIDASVSPSHLSFTAAGQSQSFTVTLGNGTAPDNEYTTGFLTWTNDATASSATPQTVRSPIAVFPRAFTAPAEVEGTGVTGQVGIDVASGGTLALPAEAIGLATGVRLTDPDGDQGGDRTGSGVEGDSIAVETTVDENTLYARFDLDAVDEWDDLDLTVELLNADGEPVEQWVASSYDASERIDLPAPEAGTYRLTADIYYVDSGAATDFDLTVFALADDADAGSFAVAPSPLRLVAGETTTARASWTALAPGFQYLGMVTFGNDGVYTLVSVDATEVDGDGDDGDDGDGDGSDDGGTVDPLVATGVDASGPASLAGGLLLAGGFALALAALRRRRGARTN